MGYCPFQTQKGLEKFPTGYGLLALVHIYSIEGEETSYYAELGFFCQSVRWGLRSINTDYMMRRLAYSAYRVLTPVKERSNGKPLIDLHTKVSAQDKESEVILRPKGWSVRANKRGDIHFVRLSDPLIEEVI